MDIDGAIQVANERYLNDFEFHHDVDRAVMATMVDVRFFDEIDEKLAREVATRAVALALSLRDDRRDPVAVP